MQDSAEKINIVTFISYLDKILSQEILKKISKTANIWGPKCGLKGSSWPPNIYLRDKTQNYFNFQTFLTLMLSSQEMIKRAWYSIN